MKHAIRLRSRVLAALRQSMPQREAPLPLPLLSCFAKYRRLPSLPRCAWSGDGGCLLCSVYDAIDCKSTRQEFGEDAATAINELLGLYGYDDESKRSELSVKFHRNSCKKIANISQKLLESKRQMRCSESESLRSKLNDYSSVSSDKDSSSREDSKSPLAMKLMEKDGE